MSKAISPDEFTKRPKKSRLATWSLIVVIVLSVFALIFAFVVLSTTNPTNQSSVNTIVSTEENSSTSTSVAPEDNSSTSVAPATYQKENGEPIEITAVFWGMLLMFFLLIFSRLRQIINRR